MSGRIFVSEFLTCGALAGQPLPASLIREGEKMWRALLEDCLAIADCELVTTHDTRLQPLSHPRLSVIAIDSPEQEADAFLKHAAETDETLLIAPELDGVLEMRVQKLAAAERGKLLSTPEAVRLASDKWAFHEVATHAGLSVPATCLLTDTDREASPVGYPAIIKPRRGAGATDTSIAHNKDEWKRRLEKEPTIENLLAQPFLNGEPVSISCIIAPGHNVTSWLPPGRQHFDGLAYTGGEVGAELNRSSEIKSLAAAAVEAIPGLRGYIGVDLLVPADRNEPVRLLEINSRLTTSYLGYRRLVVESLAERMLGLTEATTWTRAADQIEFSVLPKGGANSG